MARVVTRNDDGYGCATKQFSSTAYDSVWVRENLAPEAIVYCTCEADVIRTVQIATSAKPPVHLSARSGGHSYSGHSSRTRAAGGWIVDVSGLDSIQQIDQTVLQTGPGVRLHRLNAELLKRGLSYPKGTCRGVAVGGHLQSSGFGVLKTSHGSGLDHVLQFRMVLADGQVVVVTRDNVHKELFFCVLGGFPGSFGIVTEYTLQCIPDSECPHSRLITRAWSLPVLDVQQLAQIIAHTQKIDQDQEAEGTRDISVTLTHKWYRLGELIIFDMLKMGVDLSKSDSSYRLL